MAIDCSYKNCSCYIFHYFESTAINMKIMCRTRSQWAAIFAAKWLWKEILAVHFIMNISISLCYDIIQDPHIMVTELLSIFS